MCHFRHKLNKSHFTESRKILLEYRQLNEYHGLPIYWHSNCLNYDQLSRDNRFQLKDSCSLVCAARDLSPPGGVFLPLVPG
jgi:hypothetical protein